MLRIDILELNRPPRSKGVKLKKVESAPRIGLKIKIMMLINMVVVVPVRLANEDSVGFEADLKARLQKNHTSISLFKSEQKKILCFPLKRWISSFVAI